MRECDGKKLQKARERARKSRQELADELKVSVDLVSAWEKNWVGPSTFDIEAICVFLGCERAMLSK